MTTATVATRSRRARKSAQHGAAAPAGTKRQPISPSCPPKRRWAGAKKMLFDEMDRLAEVKELFLLLTHYATLGTPDREVWQDRLGEMDGVEPRQLVKLYGELLAHGFLEQNTGLTPVLKCGAAPSCYRITTVGLRALKQAKAEKMHAA